MKTERKFELTVKERMDLQRRLLVVQQTVGRWYNLLNSCSDGDIADIVDALEIAAGIKKGKGEVQRSGSGKRGGGMIVDVFSSERGYIRLERVDGEWRTVEWWRDWPSRKRESEYVMNWETEKWAREYVHDESEVAE